MALLCGALPLAARAAVSSGPFVQYDDSIATTLSHCVDTPANQTTVGLESCYEAADAAYEHLLHVVYPLVLKHLDPVSRSLVERSQQRWLLWQKAEFAAQRGPWTGDSGTIIEFEIPKAEALAVRDRIFELYLFWPGYATESTSFTHPWAP